MSIELLLDLLVSVLFLAIYHADLAPADSQLEFCMVTGSPDDYDLSGPTIALPVEWVLDEDPIVCIPVRPTACPTVKQLREAAKVLNVGGVSRMTRRLLVSTIAQHMLNNNFSFMPIAEGLLELSSAGDDLHVVVGFEM
jgi:hypothetical protein